MDVRLTDRATRNIFRPSGRGAPSVRNRAVSAQERTPFPGAALTRGSPLRLRARRGGGGRLDVHGISPNAGAEAVHEGGGSDPFPLRRTCGSP